MTVTIKYVSVCTLVFEEKVATALANSFAILLPLLFVGIPFVQYKMFEMYHLSG